ncbi:MAG: hypothetical protein V4584_15415 [Verrucomicrobiota bacterium]
MKPGSLLLQALILGLVLSSCGTTKSSKPEKPDMEKKPAVVEGPKLVGRIATIPADKRFVLIQSYGKWEMEAGAILTTRGPEERSANLRVTGEKLGEFAAADLQSGAVEKGDAVYSQHTPKPVATPATPELPQHQNETPSENVQKNN